MEDVSPTTSEDKSVKRVASGGEIFKMLNGAIEEINREQFIIWESWRKQKARIQREYPLAKIKYSYKTKQFTIIFGLPSDWKILKIGLQLL